MNFKNLILIFNLIIIFLISCSVVVASEHINYTSVNNETQEYYVDELEISNENIETDNLNKINNISDDEVLSSSGDDILSFSTSKITTVVNIDSYQFNYTNPINLHANITSKSGSTIKNLYKGNVTFKINDNYFVANVRNSQVDINIPLKLEPGVYSCTAEFSGASDFYTSKGVVTRVYNYLNSSSKFTITIKDYPKIIANDFNSYYLSNTKYTLQIVDDYSNLPLRDKYVDVILRNKKDGSIYKYSDFTNSDGYCNLLLDCNVGEYEAKIESSNCLSYKMINIGKSKVKISTSNIQSDNKHYTTLKAIVTGENGKRVNEGTVKFSINGNSYKVDVYKGVATKQIMLSKSRTYTYKATFLSENYVSSESQSKIFVKKYKVTVTPIKSKNIKGEKSILKATVKDCHGKKVNEGKVKFTINGKTYSVKVKNGVAIKKIKLPSVKTYTYKSKFISSNYNSKTVKSNIVVKKIPTFKVKIGKYSIKISYKDYKKIQKAKDGGYFSKKYYTGKTINYKYYVDKKVVHTKKKLYSYGTYFTYYKNNPDALKAPSGYKFAGREYKVVNGIEKTYMIYKKTTYKKVLAKTPKTKVYITIDSNEWWGSSANLYYKSYVHKDKDGGIETKYYIGKDKQIF